MSGHGSSSSTNHNPYIDHKITISNVGEHPHSEPGPGSACNLEAGDAGQKSLTWIEVRAGQVIIGGKHESVISSVSSHERSVVLGSQHNSLKSKLTGRCKVKIYLDMVRFP